MGLLNSPIELHLSSVEVIHHHLMGVQDIPDHAQRKGRLLQPLGQLLKSLGLRRTVHMTMSTRGINLKEAKSVIITKDQSRPLPERRDWESNPRDAPGYQDRLEHRRRQGKTLYESKRWE